MKEKSKADKRMRWDIILFFNALTAAILSFSEIAPVAAGVARGLCYLFLSLFLMSLIDRLLQRVEGK